jgi:surface carbohydrate biosynthesis protein (TIGR04326 family)
MVAGLTIRPPKEAFSFPGSNLAFFAVLKTQWYDSFYGSSAMSNALYSSIFQSVVRNMPQAALTLYLWENQPWELALLTAMRENGHKKIIGYQHAFPAPLNLRYIPLPSTPTPDYIVVGGWGARKVILGGGLNPAKIVTCEAVRYLHLASSTEHMARNTALLVITPMYESEARIQLSLLTKAVLRDALGKFNKIIIKPHPFLAIEGILESLGAQKFFHITTQPLVDLWPITSAAFVANSTSAVIDALYSRTPFAVCSSGDSINMNPLFETEGVAYVSTITELASALEGRAPKLPSQDYLIIDPSLTQWRTLVSNYCQ